MIFGLSLLSAAKIKKSGMTLRKKLFGKSDGAHYHPKTTAYSIEIEKRVP